MNTNLIDLTCTAANESSLGEDGLALFAPYGDARNVFTLNNPKAFREAFPTAVLTEDGGFTRVEGIQRITQENSAVIADAFNSMFAKVKRWVKGSPVYNRHPDSPGSEDTDMTVLGLVSRLEARPDGLYGFPVFSDAGADAVNGREKLFFSPRFSFVPTGVEAGRVVWEPTEFKSVGLTPNPNLAADAANAAPASGVENPKEHMNKTVLVGALIAAGVTLAADASDDAIAREIVKLGENSRLGATGANERETLKTENARLKQELETLKASADNAAKASREALINAAVADGRITEAEKGQWDSMLKADAVNAAGVLGRLTKKVKTEPRTTNNAGGADASNEAETSPFDRIRAATRAQIKPESAA